LNHLYEQNITSLLLGRAMCGERVRAMINGFTESNLDKVDCVRCLEAYRTEHAQRVERVQVVLDRISERTTTS
jgi:hypothetical protein